MPIALGKGNDEAPRRSYLVVQDCQHTGPRRLAKLIGLAVLSVGGVAGLNGVASVAVASASVASSRWVAQVLVSGEFQGLLALSGGLYSTKTVPEGARVVRVDPATGRVLARSAIMSGGLGSPSLIDGQLWALTGTPEVGRPLNVGLVAFAPGPLNTTREVRLALGPEGPTNAVALGPVAGPAGRAWAMFGCRLVQADLETGNVTRSISFGTGVGCGTSLALGGKWLYTAGPYEQGGYLRLERRSASDGALVAAGTVPAAPHGVAMATSGGYLWAAGGDPGANGSLYLYRASSLELIGSNVSLFTGVRVPGGARLPLFSAGPSLDVSGGTVWVGSLGGQAACFNASTTVLESIGVPKPRARRGRLRDHGSRHVRYRGPVGRGHGQGPAAGGVPPWPVTNPWALEILYAGTAARGFAATNLRTARTAGLRSPSP